MIAQISGKVIQKGTNCVFVDVGGIVYEVLIPSIIMQKIDDSISENGTITLLTYHYLQVDPSKSRPFLIGFLNDIEKDFFEKFITVSGIGPRAALKAIDKPISRIAQAIDEKDEEFLCQLPGVGRQRSREIIAKLQNKVARFGLIKDQGIRVPDIKEDLKKEAIQILLRLQYKKKEAEDMIVQALERCKEISTLEDLLNEIYKQTKH
jgi:Holliday junction DNA helicase RuvA